VTAVTELRIVWGPITNSEQGSTNRANRAWRVKPAPLLGHLSPARGGQRRDVGARRHATRLKRSSSKQRAGVTQSRNRDRRTAHLFQL